MKFKNRISTMIVYLLAIILFIVVAYLDNRMEYKVFIIIVVTLSSILYIFAIFEYYLVDENKLIHSNTFNFKPKEVLWRDIKSIYVYPVKYFKTIRISYGMLNENEIVINTSVKNYKKLVEVILDKTKDNPNIEIDKKVLQLGK